jgi:Carboxypeptidase regulatory-like domain
VKIYPAHFFAVMSSSLSNAFFAYLLMALSVGSSDAQAPGFLEGHLKIIAPREVELADATPSENTAYNYAEYPLIILSHDKQKEIARVTADENGNYRIALPPGDYVLDVQNRGRRHVRAAPQPFTIDSNQTVHVDMTIDTAVR